MSCLLKLPNILIYFQLLTAFTKLTPLQEQDKRGEGMKGSPEVWKASCTGWIDIFFILAAKLLKDSTALNICQHVKICSCTSHQLLVRAPKLKTNWQYLPLKSLVHLKNWHFWICGLSWFAMLLLLRWSFLSVQHVLRYAACSVCIIHSFCSQIPRNGNNFL